MSQPIRNLIFITALPLAALAAGLMELCAAPPPVPTHADVSYGPHPHQLMDIHLPTKGSGPFPVLVWYGGLWEPSKHVPDLNRFHPAGIAVVGVETRTLTDGMQEKAKAPIVYVMNDACRAVQFVRLNAAPWNLNPLRIATGGSSQGALPALYVGCAPDRADPKASDPVERESTKIICVAAHRSQPSIDPKRMQDWVPGVEWGAPAFGCTFRESLTRRDEFLPIIEKYSPENLLHKGSASVYFENNWGLTPPGGDITEMNYKVHAPAWGLGFQKMAEKAGVTCPVKYPDHPTEGYNDIWDFIVKQLGGTLEQVQGALAPVLQPFVNDRLIAGAVALVANKYKVLDVAAVGVSSLDTKTPMRANNLFWLASITKTFTSTALMMLVDEGKVNVDDAVEKYLPELKGQMVVDEKGDRHPPTHPITVKELLTHTSGIVTPNDPLIKRTHNLQQDTKQYGAAPLIREPGTKFEYNNTGIDTVGRIIEVVSGMPFADFLQQRLFGPLGMTDTGFWPNEEQISRLAKTLKWNDDKTVFADLNFKTLTNSRRHHPDRRCRCVC